MRIIRAKTPLRISFAGGGTDLEPYISKYGSKILNVTINKYCYGTLVPRDDKEIKIHSQDFNLFIQINSQERFDKEGKLGLVKAVIDRMRGRIDYDMGGFDLYLSSDVPPGTGLGTSSAVVVTILGLFNHYFNLGLEKNKLARLAWGIERIDMGMAGGYQDQYSAVEGDFSYMEFKPKHLYPDIYHPKIKQDTINELQHSLILAYTGKTHKSEDLIKETIKNIEEKEKALHAIKELSTAMKHALCVGQLDRFALGLSEGWKHKKSLSDKISPPFIEELTEIALKNGALGLKITGSGGGGVMMVYCGWNKKKQIADKLTDAGAKIWDYDFSYGGLETWEIEQ